MLGSLTQHIPQILKIGSPVPSNGKSLPYLESVHLGAERFISIPTSEFSVCTQASALMLHERMHEDRKRRVWECPETSCKYVCKCVYVSFAREGGLTTFKEI